MAGAIFELPKRHTIVDISDLILLEAGRRRTYSVSFVRHYNGRWAGSPTCS